ncbi:MAG: carboxymuconolactone decarboxylase family protein [Acidobacteria bacterium]|nr:carboxymuconolactone decarboxylase family protein [Acidobacteriota bacterium]MBS1866201.1 carboxymuconolactone decarboxylase family protein [Acidobacteriota bacterium]
MSEQLKPRIEYGKFAPEVIRSLYAIERYLHDSGLDAKLLHMLKLRASQMNGCAFCIDMHWKDARAAGESEQRLYGLDAWRESSYYTEKERAALDWAESVTLISQTHAPDEVFERLQAQFSEKEIVELTHAVAMINLWNRLAISFRAVPGGYQPKKSSATAAG